jgi:hypothetical protein
MAFNEEEDFFKGITLDQFVSPFSSLLGTELSDISGRKLSLDTE